MSKKIVILSVIVIGVAVLFLYKSLNKTPSFLYEISGQVVEVKGNSIVVVGTVRSLNPEDMRREERTVVFKITPRTVLKTRVIIITSDQLNSGQTFSPKTEERRGAISDLVIDITVRTISKNDLFTTDKAVATEINYISHDFPAL